MVQTATIAAEPEAKDTPLEQLVAATHENMAKVNALILERANSHVEAVPEIARYLVEAGGKRLRPMLTIGAAALFGKSNGNEVRFAAAVEFMHNATLLHDDVVDESKMRRGKPAARMVWGNQASVLVGDFLLGQAFLMMVETNDMEALGVLSRAAAVIAEGEVFQLSKTGDLDTTEEEYDQVIGAKTATLFEASMEVGAMAGGADTVLRKALAKYGYELGRAFQLVDDVLDFGGTAGAMGKNTGDDLREGKMTLPIILALKSAIPAEREVILSALGDAEADSKTVARVFEIMEKHGVLKQTLHQAEHCVALAQAAIKQVPESPMRILLENVATFCLQRAY